MLSACRLLAESAISLSRPNWRFLTPCLDQRSVEGHADARREAAVPGVNVGSDQFEGHRHVGRCGNQMCVLNARLDMADAPSGERTHALCVPRAAPAM